MITNIILKEGNKPGIKSPPPLNFGSAPASDHKIEIVTALDAGLAPDGSTIEGFVIGKPYVIKAVHLVNDVTQTVEPPVKWAYQYQIDEKVFEGNLGTGSGNTVSLTIENLDVCGRFLTIYTFNDLSGVGDFIDVWIHFRFRFFSRKVVTAEIDSRMKHPFLVSQNSTSLCGMAAVFYAFIKVRPEQYKSLALALHRKGTVTLNAYTIVPDISMFDVKPTPDNLSYPGLNKGSVGMLIQMPQVDWILLAGARSSFSLLKYKGQDGEDFKAINWRRIVKKLLNDFLGYRTIIDHTRYYTGFNYKNSLIQIQKDYEDGYQIIFLIDANMLENKVRYVLNTLDWHYIVYEGALTFDDHKNFIFSFYSWGKLHKNYRIRSSVFNSTFYGYYKVKI